MLSNSEEIGGFINSLNLPVYIAIVLFENWGDCVAFMNLFYAKNKFLIDDLMDFREYKIYQSTKSLKEFLDDYNVNGLKASFERMFYQSFNEDEVNILNGAIASGKVSVDELFYKFKGNHNRNILKYVL